jgi:hypothetical protein
VQLFSPQVRVLERGLAKTEPMTAPPADEEPTD